MGSSPLVSFVVPCFNYGRYLPDCLRGIFSQEGNHDFEVIAIDDASTDNTGQVLLQFDDPRMRVIRHSRNLGHVATVNEGLAEARGTFIARIDPDDRYRSNFLSTALNKFKEFPELGLVYGDAALIDDRGSVTTTQSDTAHGGKDFKGNEFLRILERNIICAPTALARREAWLSAMPIPERLAFNDWYFNLMMARAYDFYYVNLVVADYRVHPSNHHTRIVLDRSEEASTFWLLDKVLNEHEASLSLEQAKRRAKRRIYGAQYLTLADKYFGLGMNRDARRCYVRAVQNRPAYLTRWSVQRHFGATLVGRSRYELGKSLIRSALARG